MKFLPLSESHLHISCPECGGWITILRINPNPCGFTVQGICHGRYVRYSYRRRDDEQTTPLFGGKSLPNLPKTDRVG